MVERPLRYQINTCLRRATEHGLAMAEIHLNRQGQWFLVCRSTPLTLSPDLDYGGSGVLNLQGRSVWQLRGNWRRVSPSMRTLFIPEDTLNLGSASGLMDDRAKHQALERIEQWIHPPAPDTPVRQLN